MTAHKIVYLMTVKLTTVLEIGDFEPVYRKSKNDQN